MDMKIVSAVAGAAFAATGVAAQPSSFIDLGVIGAEGVYTFDTNGSTNAFGGADTELGLYDNDGIVLAADDDGGDGLQSLISINLSAGVYFLATGEFDSIFEDGFVNSGTGFEGGDDATILLNVNGSNAGSALQGDFNQTQFWRVEVVPAPGAASLLAVAGLAAARRRR